ncbi:hypothetical protein J1N35_000073 [Gossypium stocksii]|uniref:RNase H type-1 domain-containing protein n=1 Tax=Gossypium stocksii TaxID=47602 RepID=A0A9D3WGG9_9ROSI|nr:hypothetical protein J1N35_000073 [Gossypium stocksii]
MELQHPFVPKYPIDPPKKKLLILDYNGVIAIVEKKGVQMRPGAYEFLDFCFNNYQEVNLCNKKLDGFEGSLKKGFWKPSGSGFIKINFDATFQSDSRTSTIVVIARDSRGNIRGAVTYLIEDVADAFIAGTRECERSLLFARLMGFRCLVVEGDSLTPITWQWRGEYAKDLGYGMMAFRPGGVWFWFCGSLKCFCGRNNGFGRLQLCFFWRFV